VVVKVELRIGRPARWGEPPHAGHDPLPQSRYLGDSAGDSAPEVLDVGGPVADGEPAAVE
jgi:hypothetical protein